MITLKRAEWNRMARPIYPQIQFASNKDNLQVQSMVRLEAEGEYYKPVILLRKITEVIHLQEFIDSFVYEANRIHHEEKVSEEDTLLYKVEDDE